VIVNYQNVVVKHLNGLFMSKCQMLQVIYLHLHQYTGAIGLPGAIYFMPRCRAVVSVVNPTTKPLQFSEFEAIMIYTVHLCSGPYSIIAK
jgi:hypothetical protein